MKNFEGRINTFWPSIISEFQNEEHQKIKKDLINYFDEYEQQNPKGNKQLSNENYVGNYNLYQSDYDLHTTQNETIKKLFGYIGRCIAETVKFANKKQIERLKDKSKKFSVKFNESWFIRYNKEGFIFPHSHVNCSWCCLYYVQIGKDASIKNGSTYFMRPFSGSLDKNDFGSQYLEEENRLFIPKEGKLLIWPSHLLHGSHPYNGNQDRTIISINSSIHLV
tara:strand:+ start:616 stop:1281 length:666 start_codon:yes stop_codon:yes gene_type:complete